MRALLNKKTSEILCIAEIIILFVMNVISFCFRFEATDLTTAVFNFINFAVMATSILSII